MNRIHVGIPHRIYTEPLVGRRSTTKVDVTRGLTFDHLNQLHKQDLDAVFVSPLDFGREGSAYKIVPGVAVSSSRYIRLYFKNGLHDISTMAANPSNASEIILAKIIFTEEFESVPAIVPMDGSIEMMLQRADSALAVGDAMFEERPEGSGVLDIVETWEELTHLPYVHGFWCAKEDALAPIESALFQSLRDEGTASLGELANNLSKDRGVAAPVIEEYLQGFSYTFDDLQKESLREYLHYAYYYGTIPDVRDLEFLDGTETNRDTPPPISSN